MIIFVEDCNVQSLTPCFNGELNCFELNNNCNIVFNISSLSNLGEKLNIIPLHTMNVYDDRTFDIEYSMYLLNNNGVFVDFFKPIYYNYLGYNVFILIGEDPNGGRQHITESLMKLYQQRYSVIPKYVSSLEDIPDYYEQEAYTVDGVFNMDMDKERYIYLTTSQEFLSKQMEDYNA